ncbi:MAG: hypothetical protein HPY50_20825 [Firmicutes bacterium]|nr:hypothetical protein [Bacillota bacterium]
MVDYMNMNRLFFNATKEVVNKYYSGILASLHSAKTVCDKTNGMLGEFSNGFMGVKPKTDEAVETLGRMFEATKNHQLLGIDMTQEIFELVLKKGQPAEKPGSQPVAE